MAQVSSIADGIEYAKSLGVLTAITLASNGSLIVYNNEVIEINPEKVEKVIDTTGAGDLYAAGFLYGCAKNKSFEECGRYASIAASEIISHYGARPLVKLKDLI